MSQDDGPAGRRGLLAALGAIADYAAIEKRMLAGFLAMGVISIGLMFLILRGDYRLGSTVFVLASRLAGGTRMGILSILLFLVGGERSWAPWTWRRGKRSARSTETAPIPVGEAG